MSKKDLFRLITGLVIRLKEKYFWKWREEK